MTISLPPLDLPAAQPLALPPRNHAWDYLHKRNVPAIESPSNCEQTERDCKHCSLIRVTVHPPRGNPYRAWRYAGSETQFTADKTPKCQPRAKE